MTEIDETMSGGGGSGTAGVKPPSTLTDLFGNTATLRFLIDPEGSKIETSFNLLAQKVAITVNGQTVEVAYKKL